MFELKRNCRANWVSVILFYCFGSVPLLLQAQSVQQPRSRWDAVIAEGAKRSAYPNPLHQQTSADQMQEGNSTDSSARFEQEIRPLLQSSCVHCHGPDNQEGNVRIDNLSPDLLNGPDVDWWLEVQAVLSKGEMPPPDEGDLSDEDRGQIIEWLSNEIQIASKLRRATAGHSSFRRMTRYEYNYAMQDMLGLPWDFARDLPPEAASADGFENSSESLHMSVSQLEMYRRLAHRALTRATVVGQKPSTIYWGVRISDAAKVDWSKQESQLVEVAKQFPDDQEKQGQERQRLLDSFQETPPFAHYRNLATQRTVRATWNYDEAKYALSPSETQPTVPETFDQVAVLPGGRHEKLTIELGDRLPDEGTLRVRVLASRTLSVANEGSKDGNEDDRCPSMQLEFGWQASNEGRALLRVSDEDIVIAATPDDPQFYQWEIPLGEIYPRNMVRNQFPMGAMPSPSEYIKLVNSSVSADDLQIYYVEVTAPVFDRWPPESHQRIFFPSANQSDSREHAKQILVPFMRRAWRRPITGAEIEQKLKLFDAMQEHAESFQEAVVEVLATVLSSPDFLYLANHNTGDSTTENASPQALSSHELANRLSIFLWCSIPDDRLLELASSNELKKLTVLSAEVDRMLKDDRSQRFAEHFVHQWLDMQLLEFLNLEQPGFDPLLKEAMQHEPVAFFREVLNNNESVLKFVHADYAMVNQRLAQHYGLPNVHGNHFRRVPLVNVDSRGGLLTQAGLLAMNSDGTDSHPLKRGVWLLKSILNDPPPPPPPAVPQIDLADPEIAKMTLKERIENHRDHAACYSCHSKIDPWGIAFENYDATGHWRDEIQGRPVDASSQLFNHQELSGVEGLKRYLLENRQDQLVRAIVYKLAAYSLGRPLTFADHAQIDQITAETRRQGDGLATIIHLLLASELFQTE